ncbi:hypothetical protein D9611_007405 [Ephemerocybe angulata]|uniref:Uncharacterized protein n=1 Tax=Ephemerocybe angulata TaxID=980116 RepID=A0A8H5CFL1_9AGAR|nr:hypothetical protein D9611_007405 [Tulosesus angulatus]
MHRLSYHEEHSEDTEALLHPPDVPKPHRHSRHVRNRSRVNQAIALLCSGSRRRVFLKILTALTSLFFIFVILAAIFRPWATILPRQTPNDTNTSLPPRYTAIRKHTASLPQHNVSLPPPEGHNGRYIKFTSQISQLGWNNVLNEVLLNAHLAYRAKRAYVFGDYDWKKEYFPWPENVRFEDPPRTPLGALLGGPVVGDPWVGLNESEVREHPRSVNIDFWEEVCPPKRRRVIKTSDVKPWHKLNTYDKSGSETLELWLKLLTDPAFFLATSSVPNLEVDEDDWSCVEIVPAPQEEDSFPQVFDLWLWGCERILDLWDEFKASPMSSLGLRTGSVVLRGVERNMGLFTRHRQTHEVRRAREEDPMERTLAIHIRRGDFVQACQDLADWNSTYYSWNQLPFLPDHFVPPPYPPDKERGTNNNSPENVATYLGHCLPDDDAIARKVEQARLDWEAATNRTPTAGHFLDTIFLLTNERDPVWLGKLKAHFMDAGGWKNVVVSSLEVMYGDAQELDVGMAIDMELAKRAAVFVGNGFSSFTSNILHRRLVDEKIPISNRFF